MGIGTGSKAVEYNNLKFGDVFVKPLYAVVILQEPYEKTNFVTVYEKNYDGTTKKDGINTITHIDGLERNDLAESKVLQHKLLEEALLSIQVLNNGPHEKMSDDYAIYKNLLKEEMKEIKNNINNYLNN